MGSAVFRHKAHIADLGRVEASMHTAVGHRPAPARRSEQVLHGSGQARGVPKNQCHGGVAARGGATRAQREGEKSGVSDLGASSGAKSRAG